MLDGVHISDQWPPEGKSVAQAQSRLDAERLQVRAVLTFLFCVFMLMKLSLVAFGVASGHQRSMLTDIKMVCLLSPCTGLAAQGSSDYCSTRGSAGPLQEGA